MLPFSVTTRPSEAKRWPDHGQGEAAIRMRSSRRSVLPGRVRLHPPGHCRAELHAHRRPGKVPRVQRHTASLKVASAAGREDLLFFALRKHQRAPRRLPNADRCEVAGAGGADEWALQPEVRRLVIRWGVLGNPSGVVE